MIPGIIIICLVVACFIAFGIWFFVQGIKPIVPEGTKYTLMTSTGIKFTLVTQNLSIVELKAHVPLAGRLPQQVFLDTMEALLATWGNTYNVTPKKVLDNMYVVFYTDAAWEKLLTSVGYTPADKVVAFQNRVPQRVGQGPVQINIQASAGETDYLLIHEALHALLSARANKDPDRMHNDSLIWGQNQVQGIERSVQIAAMKE